MPFFVIFEFGEARLNIFSSSVSQTPMKDILSTASIAKVDVFPRAFPDDVHLSVDSGITKPFSTNLIEQKIWNPIFGPIFGQT